MNNLFSENVSRTHYKEYLEHIKIINWTEKKETLKIVESPKNLDHLSKEGSYFHCHYEQMLCWLQIVNRGG